MKKCAFIRSDKDGTDRCPFGLPITEACRHAGDSVSNMAPIEMVDEEKRERVEKANKRVYIYYKTGDRCIYAANIMEDQKAVNCNFGDHAQGAHMPKAPEGSPLYAQTFSGIGLDGLYAFPLGFYADNSASRNLFHGLFSLVGEATPIIIKEAICEEDCDLWEKVENQDILLPDEQNRLNEILSDVREKIEDNKDDPAKLKELVDKWNPRKNL